MAQIKITASAAATLRALRNLSTDNPDRKAAKKDIFNTLRNQFRIPQNIKLKVEIDDTAAADFLVVKDKTTGRELVATDGVYSGLATPVPTVTASVTPATQAPAAITDGRFAVATGADVTQTVNRISVANLLAALRDDYSAHDSAEVDVDLPAGAPALRNDQVLVDNQEGFVYFLA